MIEREFVEQKKKEFQIQEFVSETLKNAGHSHTKLQRTPLGEKVVIYTSRPGLIVGRKGQTISKLTEVLKKKFGLENPQVEIAEVSNPMLDSRIVAERIVSELERFGANRFKGIMHKAAESVLGAGAVGVEIRMAGKLPGARAKRWRVAGGYLRKCGDAAVTYVDKTIMTSQLKSGVIGVQVRIMPQGFVMPDEIRLKELEGPATAAVATEAGSSGDSKQIVSETVPETGMAAAASVTREESVDAKAEEIAEVDTGKKKTQSPAKRKRMAKPKSKNAPAAEVSEVPASEASEVKKNNEQKIVGEE